MINLSKYRFKERKSKDWPRAVSTKVPQRNAWVIEGKWGMGGFGQEKLLQGKKRVINWVRCCKHESDWELTSGFSNMEVISDLTSSISGVVKGRTCWEETRARQADGEVGMESFQDGRKWCALKGSTQWAWKRQKQWGRKGRGGHLLEQGPGITGRG